MLPCTEVEKTQTVAAICPSFYLYCSNIILFTSSHGLFLFLTRKPYQTHEVKGSWEKMPDGGTIRVVAGRARERGNRYLRGRECGSRVSLPPCRAIVRSCVKFSMWSMEAARHWRLTQQHVLFSVLWHCIRTMKRYQINKWRIQRTRLLMRLQESGHYVIIKSVLLECKRTQLSAPICPTTTNPERSFKARTSISSPCFCLLRCLLLMSCWQATLIPAKDAPSMPFTRLRRWFVNRGMAAVQLNPSRFILSLFITPVSCL